MKNVIFNEMHYLVGENCRSDDLRSSYMTDLEGRIPAIRVVAG